MEQKIEWVNNYPRRGQKALFIDNKLARSQVVPRGKDLPAVEQERPVIIPMTVAERRQSGSQPVRKKQ